MSTSLKEQISADMKEAMKARDQVRVDTLRAALSAFTYKRTESGKDVLDYTEEVAVIQKQVKQRNDSITEYTKAGRTELAEKEQLEKDILSKYLPAQKSESELKEIIQKIMNDLPEGQRNQGNIMKTAMAQLKGVADGNVVKKIVGEILGQ